MFELVGVPEPQVKLGAATSAPPLLTFCTAPETAPMTEHLQFLWFSLYWSDKNYAQPVITALQMNRYITMSLWLGKETEISLCGIGVLNEYKVIEI